MIAAQESVATCDRLQSTRKGGRRSNWQLFGWPVIVGLAAIAGLVLGLTGDGLRDVLAVALLCLAPAIMLRAWARRS